MYLKRGFWIVTLFSVLLGMFSAGAGFRPQIAEAASAQGVPVKKIPGKRIPKTHRYYQAPAYDKRARKNRKLVLNSRSSGRELRRTGSAYGEDFR